MRLDVSIEVQPWEVILTIFAYFLGCAARALYDWRIEVREKAECQQGYLRGLEESQYRAR